LVTPATPAPPEEHETFFESDGICDITRALISLAPLRLGGFDVIDAIPESSPDRRPVLLTDNYTGFGFGGESDNRSNQLGLAEQV
jgi:hypothetical protein